MHAAIRDSKYRESLDSDQLLSSVLERDTDSASSELGSSELEPYAARRGPPADRCPSGSRLRSFVEGSLRAAAVLQIDSHMSVCPACCERVIRALSARTQAPLPIEDTGAKCLSLPLGACLADRYLVYRSLGQGGMGEVYEALDLELEQPVAIKTIRARVSDNPEATHRLAGEFDLTRRVQHLNVRQVYHLGMQEVAQRRGTAFPFISMELIDGESLAKLLRRGAMDLSNCVSIAAALLAAVAATHRAGIIHRDIKSHNVLLRQEPTAPLALIDFGLAIEAGRVGHDLRAGGERLGPFSPEGSPAYMAPEQFNSDEASFASDVFSCGVVFFQLLTGRFPFQSLSCMPRIAMRRDPREVPCRLRTLAPELPTWIDEFVARCLELDPAARYVDASEALAALRDSSRGLTSER